MISTDSKCYEVVRVIHERDVADEVICLTDSS